MQNYKTVLQEVQIPTTVYCDCCKKQIDQTKEDFIHIEKQWGYCSNKDGDFHSFDICEQCYDTWTNSFLHTK